MKGIRQILYVTVIYLSCLVTVQCTSDIRPGTWVKKGVLDLRNVKLDESTIIPLSGDWNFYWQKLYAGKQPIIAENEVEYFTVPGKWNRKKTSSGEITSNWGYATYHLKILTPVSPNPLKATFLLPKAINSHAIFQQNSIQMEPHLVNASGKVSTTKEGYIPKFGPSHVHLELVEETDIYIQVSNFLDSSGSGIVMMPILGSESAILKHERTIRQVDFTIVGVILSVGLFMLLLFFFRQTEKAPLWMSLFCFVVAVRMLWSKHHVHEIFFYTDYFELFHRIEYLSMTLAVITYLMYLVNWFPQSFKNRLIYGFIFVSLTYSLATALLPIPMFTRILNPFMVFILLVFVAALIIFVKSLIKKFDVLLLLVFLGTLSVITFGFMEINIRLWLNTEVNVIQYGLLLNVLFLGFARSLSNSLARKKLERLSITLTGEVKNRQTAEEEVKKVNQNLEQLVKERTGELEDAYEKLVDNAHKAGMAEIAANTLHNVGNVLNSLVTSANVIREKVINSPLGNYSQANQLLREHLNDFSDFVKKDPKGQKLLEYYLELETAFLATFSGIMENVDRLNSKSDSIANIIMSQKNMVGSAQLVESLDMKDIIEDALGMLPNSFHSEGITINKSYGKIPEIPIQKSKLLHILVNLFMNAFHAMQSNDHDQKNITIELSCDDKRAWIKIIDSGTGISKENMAKVFLHGFTTKKEGRGFGLHSCAIYMEEMEGQIKAESDGEGKGTTMTLIFPIVQNRRIESKSLSEDIKQSASS